MNSGLVGEDPLEQTGFEWAFETLNGHTLQEVKEYMRVIA